MVVQHEGKLNRLSFVQKNRSLESHLKLAHDLVFKQELGQENISSYTTLGKSQPESLFDQSLELSWLELRLLRNSCGLPARGDVHMPSVSVQTAFLSHLSFKNVQPPPMQPEFVTV